MKKNEKLAGESAAGLKRIRRTFVWFVFIFFIFNFRLSNVVEGNSVYPRVITPNGDGINDVVFFLIENPTDEQLTGNIYNSKLLKVADVKKAKDIPGNNTDTVLSWDGKDDSGATVPGGVYFYKIAMGDKTFTGIVAVMR